MKGISVRPLTGRDAQAFFGIRLEALEQVPHAFAESAEEFRATSIDALESRLSRTDGGSFLLGAFSGAQLIGTAGFARGERLKDRHKGRVWGVYVSKDYRAQGVGRELLSELIRRASLQTGLEQIVLTVGAEQAAAKALYSSLGFEVFGRERHALKVGESYVDEDYMVFTVPRSS